MRAVAERAKPRGLPAFNDRPRRFERLEMRRIPSPGAQTLDDRISAVWSALVADGSTECPVCAGAVHAARPCSACGSELS